MNTPYLGSAVLHVAGCLLAVSVALRTHAAWESFLEKEVEASTIAEASSIETPAISEEDVADKVLHGESLLSKAIRFCVQGDEADLISIANDPILSQEFYSDYVYYILGTRPSSLKLWTSHESLESFFQNGIVHSDRLASLLRNRVSGDWSEKPIAWEAIRSDPNSVGGYVVSNMIIANGSRESKYNFLQAVIENLNSKNALKKSVRANLVSQARGIEALWRDTQEGLATELVHALWDGKKKENLLEYYLGTDLARFASSDLSSMTALDFVSPGMNDSEQAYVLRNWARSIPIHRIRDLDLSWIESLSVAQRRNVLSALVTRLGQVDPIEALKFHDLLESDWGIEVQTASMLRHLVDTDILTASALISLEEPGKQKDDLIVALIQVGRLSGIERTLWVDQLNNEDLRRAYLR